jgi:multiple sugar transport system ATP-binding protein
MAAVELDGIVKAFGEQPVLRGVDLQVADGEFIALVGPSGCGKSTLLRIIAGLESQDQGAVRIAGERVDAVRPSRRNLAMVFQSYALYPHLSVADNIALPLRMRRLTALQRLPGLGRLSPGRRRIEREIAADVARTAGLLDIAALLHRKPGQLSGGQRQRVAVGRAIVRAPQAFLFDEPLSNLDAKLRVHMRAELAQLHRSLKATFVYVTHDQAEAMTMSSRIAVMMDGEIVQIGPPAEVYERPADLRVAEFIGSPKINVLPAEAVQGRLELFGRPLAAAPGLRAGACRIAIRPERIALGGAEGWTGIVTHVEHMGPELFVHCGLPRLAAPVIVRIDPADAIPAVGAPVGLRFSPEHLHVFDASGRRLAVTPGRLGAAPLREPAYG